MLDNVVPENLYATSIKPFMSRKSWGKFKKDINLQKNSPNEIDPFLKDQNLDKVTGLKDYILNTNSLKKDEVNNLIQKQNLTNIAESAKGFSGVSDAIKTYNSMINNSSEDTKTFLEQVNQTNPKLADAMKKYDDGSMRIRNYASSLAGATLKTASLQATSMAMSTFINLGVSTAISALMTGLDYLINYDQKQEEAFQNAKQNADNYNSALRQTQKETAETNAKAREISSEYATLVQGVNPFTNENKNLSTENYERFLELNNQLAELFPSLTKNYDENGNAILGLSGDIDTVTASISALVQQQAQLAKSDIKKNLKGFVEGDDDSEGQLKVIKGTKEKYLSAKTKETSLKDTYTSIINKNGKKKLWDTDYSKYLDEIETSLGIEARNAIKNIAQFTPSDKGNSSYLLDFSKLQLSDSDKAKITDSYKSFYADLEQTTINAKAELDSANADMSSNLMIWVEDTPFYKEAGENMKIAVSQMVSSIHWDELNIDSLEGAEAYIQKTFITPISQACKDSKQKAVYTEAINSLFTMDFSKLSYKDANVQIQKFLTTVMNTMNKNLPNGEKKTLLDMYDMFGLGTYDQTTVDMRRNLDAISSKNPDELNHLKEYTKDFTQSQTQDWLTATDGIKGTDNAIKAYEALQSQKSQPAKSFTDAFRGLDSETKDELYNLATSGKLTGAELSSLATKHQDLKMAIESCHLSTDEFSTKIQEVNINKLNKDASQYQSALEKVRAGQSLSAEEMGSLVSKNSELANSVIVTKDGYTLEAEALTSVTNASIQNRNTAVANQIFTTTSLLNNTNKRITAIRGEIKTLESLSEAQVIMSTTGSVSDLVNSYKKGTTSNKDSAIDKKKKELNKLLKEQKKYKKQIEKLRKSIKNLNTSDTDSTPKAKTQYDWIETRLSSVSKLADKAQKAIERMFNFGSKSSKTRSALSAITKEFNNNEKAASRYMKKANQTRLSDKYKNLVKNGKIGSPKDIQNITTDSRLQKKIETYKTYYEKAQNCKTATEELAGTIQSLSESLANIPIEKAEKEIEKLEKSSTLARARAENKTSASEKNQQIDTEIENLKNSTNESKSAADSAGKNLNKGANAALKTSYKGLSSKDRKNIKNKIRSRKPITDSLLEKVRKSGSAFLYSKLIQYNRFLDANDTAQYNYNLAEQENQKNIREDEVEKLQNEADEIQGQLDLSSATKENLTSASEKNNVIKEEMSLTEQLYAKKIAIANKEKNSLEAEKLRADLVRELISLEQEKFDNITQDYENQLSIISNRISDIDNLLSLDEAYGKQADTSLYKGKIEEEQQTLSMLQSEKAALESQHQTMQKGTREWYDQEKAIQDVKNSISNCQINMAEYRNSIIEANDALIELKKSYLDISDAYLANVESYLSRYEMTDENTGNFTEKGLAALNLYQKTYETASEKKVIDSEELERLKNIISNYESQPDKITYLYENNFNSIEEVWEKYKEYSENVNEDISDMISAEENIISLMKERYETELSYMQNLINSRKEALSKEQELYEYQKSIREKTDNIASLQKQIIALRGDGSEEAKGKLQTLQSQLDDANEDLMDVEYDKYISDQQEMLDNLYQQYESVIQDLMTDVDALLFAGNELARQNGEKLDTILNQFSTTFNTGSFDQQQSDVAIIRKAITKNQEDNQKANEAMKIISEIGELDYDGAGRARLVAAENAYSSLTDDQRNIVNAAAVNGLSTLQQKQAEWLNKVKEHDDQGKRDAFKNYLLGDFCHNPNYWEVNKYKNLSETQKKIAGIYQNTTLKENGKNKRYVSATGMNYLEQKFGLSQGTLLSYLTSIGYSDGGIAESLKRIPTLNGDDGWITVKRGEAILTPMQTSEFQKMVANMNPFVSTISSLLQPDFPKYVLNPVDSTSVENHVELHIDMPNVTDSQSLIRAFQNDRKVQETISQAVLDPLTGKGRLNITRIR